MKATLKSGKFWGGVLAGAVLLTVFPQFSPRALIARPKKA